MTKTPRSRQTWPPSFARVVGLSTRPSYPKLLWKSIRMLASWGIVPGAVQPPLWMIDAKHVSPRLG